MFPIYIYRSLYSKIAATPPKTRAPKEDPRATAAPVAKAGAVVVPWPAVVTGVADGDGEAGVVGGIETGAEIVQGQLVMVRVVADVTTYVWLLATTVVG